MDNILDGDWFCYECRNKATGQRNCIVCGKPGNKTVSVLSDQCPEAYPIVSLQPPMAKVKRTVILPESPTVSGKTFGFVVRGSGSMYGFLSLFLCL